MAARARLRCRPCPTTIFTLGLLMLADRAVPIRLLAIPMIWALIGSSAAVLIGMPEDLDLLTAGLATAVSS